MTGGTAAWEGNQHAKRLITELMNCLRDLRKWHSEEYDNAPWLDARADAVVEAARVWLAEQEEAG